MNLFELFAKISLKDEASNGIKKISDGLGKGLETAAKVGLAAVGAAATGIIALTKEAVQGYAEFEQLAGGAQKIFNEMDYSRIAQDAQDAYKTMNISANEYLSLINDTGATFAATMGDEAGYETAKSGLQAIADYASGTGKDVSALSEKFTMITRSASSYQSIADQFSGILPATSKDFLAQAQAAGFLSSKYKDLAKVPIAEYQQAVSKMLEKGTEDLGLAGNTAAETAGTLSGSLNAAKAAWSNMLVGMADENANFEQLMNNLVYTLAGDGSGQGGVINNLLPRIRQAILGISTLVREAAPVIIEQLPVILDEVVPSLIETSTELVAAVIEVLPSLVDSIVQALIDNAPMLIVAAVEIILALAGGLISATPKLVKALPQIIQETVNELKSSKNIQKFLQVGEDLIAGLKNGIADAWKNLKKWFSGLFDDIIGIAKKILGIASPSKVFKKIGLQTAEGYGIGFEDEFARVQKDMEDALNFDDASIGINSSIRSVGGAAGFGGTTIGNITINVNGANYSDEQSLAAAIAQEIQTMTDRRVAVYA